MKDQLDKLEGKLDSIDSRLNNIDVTLALQHKSLDEHMRRTELLEDQIKPLNTFKDRAEGIIKFLLASGALFYFAKLLRLL